MGNPLVMQAPAQSRPILPTIMDPWDALDYGSEFDDECEIDHEQEKDAFSARSPSYLPPGAKSSLSGSAPRNDWISSVSKSPLTTQHYSAKLDTSAQLRRTSSEARFMRDSVIPVDLPEAWEEISSL